MAGVVSGGLAPNAALSRHEQNSPGFAVNPRCSHGGDVGLGDAGTMLPKVAGVPEITLHLTAGTARNSYITNPPRHPRSRQSDLPPQPLHFEPGAARILALFASSRQT